MKILCIEDDKTTAMTLSRLLEKWKYSVFSASNGIEALQILASKNPPQLILTDWIMPELNGLEFTKKVRKKFKGKFFYIIILSSKTNKNDIVEGLMAGANDYILKPFDPLELKSRINVGVKTIALQNKLAMKVKELKYALDRIKKIEGLVPICMYCKKIRTPDNYWQQIEEYIEKHSDARFTHGICNDCLEKVMKENNLTKN
ncbi:MAG TPA: response regulator transcription factor [Victivallales bacterium]|nr:response regulator transcription factor [Victivallales bacterium]HPO89892.1 response regulator transcription factor [Victivallales bacterium]HRR05685.1 response regulator transcription factor [Victivallales bacterium]HRR28086.1 response regulator transcription factor [Victivallales bacterium]HRU01191.1 response regulator transcription factor [Victivallales bacterium]